MTNLTLKRILLTTFIFATGFVLKASNDADSTETNSKRNTKKFSHAISVNATFFIKQFLSFSNSTVSIQTSPYIFDYRFIVNQKHGAKFSVGGNWKSSNKQIDLTQSTASKNLGIDYRAGYFYNVKLSRRWALNAGVDFVGNIANSQVRNNTQFDIATTNIKSISFGGGPSLGVLFNINKRIALFTETGFNYMNTSQTEKRTFMNNPNFNQDLKTNENKIEFIIPASIFFSIKF